MTTRRELITAKYLTLTTSIREYTHEPIFPSLDDIDVADLIYFITFTFLGVDDLGCRNKLREIVELHQIQVSTQQFDAIFPIVKEFLEWMKTI